ncbi:molecular chaperone TorD family protein [Eggerthella sinensis]|uniref:molecular chaperone TorD family protein n=1 Tax=Eggerthella sinensis TaxID=242230 RepID=UPI0022E1C804|nr:molecular chaperone TorD family protein [Eggerthella sinensis]
MTEVLACYRTYGFDHRALEGFQPLVGALRPDHLAAELAFMRTCVACRRWAAKRARRPGASPTSFSRARRPGASPTSFSSATCSAGCPRSASLRISAVRSMRTSSSSTRASRGYVQLIDACVAWLELDAHDGAAPACAC